MNSITFLHFYRHKIHSYSQSGAGLQSLEAQLFTASDIPLQTLDFSENSLRRLTERTFDGIEDTLKELNLRNNKLGDQLNSMFSSGEFNNLRNLQKLDLSGNKIKDFQSGIFSGLVNLEVSYVGLVISFYLFIYFLHNVFCFINSYQNIVTN